jgi:hypothetical protein
MSPRDHSKGSPARPDEKEVVVEISEDFGKVVTRVTGDVAQVNQVLETIMDAKQPFAQKHFAAIAGIAFVLLALVLAFAFDNPTRLQRQLILVIVALGGGAFSLEFAKQINANMSLGKQLSVAAGGAAAVFVILYFFVPAGLNRP